MTIETWAVIGIIVFVFLVGIGVGLWGSYQFTRGQRRDSTSYIPSSTQQPSQPTPLPPEPLSPDEPRYDLPLGRLVWGQENSPPRDSTPVRWGEPEVERTVRRSTGPDNEVVNCPLCRNPVNEVIDVIFKCPHCGAIYHLEHWQDHGQTQCPICRQEVT